MTASRSSARARTSAWSLGMSTSSSVGTGMARRLACFSTMNRKLAAPVVNAVVLRVGAGLETLLWRRADMPDRWSLPGGFVRDGESLAGAMRRHLVEKVGVTQIGHVEQLDTTSSADTHPDLWLLDVAHLALIARGAEPDLPPDTQWHPVDALPPIAFGHAAAVHRAHERLRG